MIKRTPYCSSNQRFSDAAHARSSAGFLIGRFGTHAL